MTQDKTTSDSFQIKDTLQLPKTDFDMRAKLPTREPEILKSWQEKKLYQAMQKRDAALPAFNLHWGPPYANGMPHVGHCINFVLKDAITRSKRMEGYNAMLVPGWDCHGLPIEWKIEEKYRNAGKDKDAVDVLEFREECRQFAEHWVGVQSDVMQRVGVCAEFDSPYRTMDLSSEATIAEEIHGFLKSGSIVRGVKPVMWSVVEQTALAEAEVEYKEHTSKTIYVAFPVKDTKHAALKDAQIVIWTTTPWTIPANRATAVGKDIIYSLYTVTETQEEAYTKAGMTLLLADALAENVLGHMRVTTFTKGESFSGAELAGTVLHHPLQQADPQGYGFDVPLLLGDFVTTDAGTGIVHIAPSHGEDDYWLGQANGIETPETVDDAGCYTKVVGLFEGLEVYTQKGKEGRANTAVMDALREKGQLLGQGRLRHQYPHSWRSKAPLIFRTTPQWFISMEKNDLRKKALSAIKDTKWFPESGEKRISNMVEGRPDWCISRQRAWGVPLSFFVNKDTQEPLVDIDVLDRTIAFFNAEGSDAWFSRPNTDFLRDKYDADQYEKVMDIVDVWFESGVTHAFVCKNRDDLTWPADLYLEGSDQHRGWFQSSLLASCGNYGRAPFNQVLTTGFVLDGKGYKMSKSLGNVITAEKAFGQYGADIIRLWVLGSNYTHDLRVSPEILKTSQDTYRRIRNTLRFLLGNLEGFTAAERVDLSKPQDLPELEQWTLSRLVEVEKQVRKGFADYDFNSVVTTLHDFCNLDLSAFVFDIRKDRLYCDGVDDPKRRATRTVLEQVFTCLTAWLAPILAFTAEEAWQARGEGVAAECNEASVHLRRFPNLSENWQNAELMEKWERLRAIRKVITGAIEVERAEKRIRSSLEAAPIVTVGSVVDAELLNSINLADMVITSSITVQQSSVDASAFTLDEVAGVSVVATKTEGEKCQRCWKILPEVAESSDGVCGRCAEVLEPLAKVAA